MIRFSEVFTFEHLYESAKAACRGVRWKCSTQMFEANMLSWVSNLKTQLDEGTYRSKGFNKFIICERGKMRRIQSIHISERTVQKCLVRYCLRPLIMPKLIADNCATLPGKGTEHALNRLKEHLRWWYARHRRDGCVLTMDYHDYFASIDHEILKSDLRALDMDDRLFSLTSYFIDCFEGGKGLGLGSEISQVCAVFYANKVDHLAKDRLGFHCYGRYMDDSYLIGNRDDVREALSLIAIQSAALGLELNAKATLVRPLTHGFHYLKKRVMLTDNGKIVMRLERDNICRERKRIIKNEQMVSEGRMTRESADQSFQSWSAYASRYDAHKTLEEMAEFRNRLIVG